MSEKIQPNPAPQQRPIQSYVLGAILVLLLLAVCTLFAPFFTALLWATLLYIMLSPLHSRLIKGIDFNTLKGKILRNFWAVLFTLGTMVIILIPLSLVVSIFFRQMMELGRNARNLLNEQPEYLHNLLDKIAGFITDVSAGQIVITAESIDYQIKAFLSGELQQFISLSSNLARNVGGFSVNLLFITFSMFFFYMDGPYLSRLVLHAIPIRREYISALTAKFMDITRSLIFGYIIVALVQSVVAFIIYSIFSIDGSLVLAVLTFIVVFIPMVGATVVYIPLAVLKIISGDVVGGIIFLIVSSVCISGIDNILRPLFLRDRIQLHPLIIFFAILGGITAFGFNGLILGPVLVILFLTVLDLFLTEHKIGQQDQLELF